MIENIPPELAKQINQVLAEEARRMLARSAPVVTGPGGDFLKSYYLGSPPEVDVHELAAPAGGEAIVAPLEGAP